MALCMNAEPSQPDQSNAPIATLRRGECHHAGWPLDGPMGRMALRRLGPSAPCKSAPRAVVAASELLGLAEGPEASQVDLIALQGLVVAQLTVWVECGKDREWSCMGGCAARCVLWQLRNLLLALLKASLGDLCNLINSYIPHSWAVTKGSILMPEANELRQLNLG